MPVEICKHGQPLARLFFFTQRPREVVKRLLRGFKVTGRWHDNRHTFITDLAESAEASDETIRDLAGHVSKRMLKHYSHVRMAAKRKVLLRW